MNSPFCQWILVLVHWHLHYIYKLTERPVVLLNAIFTYKFAVDPTFSSCLFMPQGSYSIIRKFTIWTLSLKRTDYLIPFGWSHDYACSIGVLITTIRFVRPLNSNQKCTTCHLGFWSIWQYFEGNRNVKLEEEKSAILVFPIFVVILIWAFIWWPFWNITAGFSCFQILTFQSTW